MGIFLLASTRLLVPACRRRCGDSRCLSYRHALQKLPVDESLCYLIRAAVTSRAGSTRQVHDFLFSDDFGYASMTRFCVTFPLPFLSTSLLSLFLSNDAVPPLSAILSIFNRHLFIGYCRYAVTVPCILHQYSILFYFFFVRDTTDSCSQDQIDFVIYIYIYKGAGKEFDKGIYFSISGLFQLAP